MTRMYVLRRGSGRSRVWFAVGLLAVVIVLLVGLTAGLAACAADWGGRTTPTSAGTDTTAVAGATDETGASANVVADGDGLASPAQTVAALLGPSVVNIKVRGSQSSYFQPPGQGYDFEWEGSGVIYSAGGMIITNNHMVTNLDGSLAENFEVTLATGEKLAATVVGTDPLTDLAVVKVEAGFDLPAATFVTDLPAVGEYAITIGSPLGYENSVSLGIVSGLDRSIEEVTGTEGVAYNNLIQTDAPISPGNSGGALANASAQVIGINVAYEPPETGAVSIGFAIPSVVVTQVADQIITTGKATHAYIGISTRTVTSALQEQFGLSRSSGILVAEVAVNGPAAKAGIQRDDIITMVGGEAMVESSDLLVAIRDKRPGDKVDVTIDRGGTSLVITVTLEERPTDY